MTAPSTLAQVSLFTAADRCDRCGARASLFALLHAGGQVMLCGYHADAHRSALSQVALVLEDFAPLAEDRAARAGPAGAVREVGGRTEGTGAGRR